MGPLSPELAGMPVDVADEVVHGRRLRHLDKGGQGIHIRGSGTVVVPVGCNAGGVAYAVAVPEP